MLTRNGHLPSLSEICSQLEQTHRVPALWSHQSNQIHPEHWIHPKYSKGKNLMLVLNTVNRGKEKANFSQGTILLPIPEQSRHSCRKDSLLFWDKTCGKLL